MSRILLFCSIILTISLGILLLSVYILGIPAMGTYLIKVGLFLGGGCTVFIWSFRRFFGKERTNVILKSIIVLGVTIVILLIISEFTVRFVFKDITTTPDNKSYFSRCWIKSNVRLNSWGFREREFKLVKPDGVYRIAVVGDSFTYGQGIEEKDRFTNLLGKYLNRSEDKYEIINFGKCGSETIDQIDTLEDIVLKVDPDFLLLQWYKNDVKVKNHDKKRRRESGPLLPFKRLRSTLHSNLFRSSALYYLINQQWNLLLERLGHSGNYIYHKFMRFGDPESPDSREYERILKKFINLCKDREIPLGIVLFPHSALLGKAYPYAYLHNRVIEICNQEGIPCIDLRYTFAPYKENKQLWANRFDSHPSSLANRLAAKQLMGTFRQFWLSGTIDR